MTETLEATPDPGVCRICGEPVIFTSVGVGDLRLPRLVHRDGNIKPFHRPVADMLDPGTS